MSGRGVPDYTLAQSMQSIPMQMSRLQLSLDEKSEINRDNCEQVNSSRSSHSLKPPIQSSKASVTRASKPASLPPKPLKSSLKSSHKRVLDQKTLTNREGLPKAFGSPNSSLESISEKSEPEELTVEHKDIGVPQVVLSGNQDHSSLPAFPPEVKVTEPPQAQTQLYSDKGKGSDDEDNIPLAALVRRDLLNRPIDKAHPQPSSNKKKERTRSVSFSAYTEYIPNNAEVYTDDDSSSLHSYRRTFSCDNLSELGERIYDDSYYNPLPRQIHDTFANYSRRESSPHPNMKSSVYTPGERKMKSHGHQTSIYQDNYYDVHCENAKPILSQPSRYVTASTDQFADSIPHTAYRNREHRNSTPQLNNAYINDPYFGGYGHPSDDYFGNQRHSLENTVYSSLSRTSGMRSALSTTSLPATMFSFVNYENQHITDTPSYRSGYGGSREAPSRSFSVSRSTGRQYVESPQRSLSVSRNHSRQISESHPRSTLNSRSNGRQFTDPQLRSTSVSRAPTPRMSNGFSPDLGRATVNPRNMYMR